MFTLRAYDGAKGSGGPATSGRLGAVERLIGLFEKLGDVGALPLLAGDADADADGRRTGVQVVRSGEVVDEALRQDVGRVGRRS